MSKKEKDIVDDEKRQLAELMKIKFFRSFVWNQIIEPCRFGYAHAVRDDIQNAKVLAKHNVAAGIVENMKYADLDLYFQMERESRELDEGNEE